MSSLFHVIILALGLSSSSSSSSSSSGSIWQPQVAASWQIILTDPIDVSSLDSTTEIYDIDLWINDAATISALHAANRKVICYFSAGSYENYRPDKDAFQPSDLGRVLDGWPDEQWLDLRSDNVRQVIATRLDQAKQKGCDGVDPDNVDGYDNDNGLGLTQADSVDFVNWLAAEARSRGLSIGLKNAGSIIPQVIENMQWCVNEQCAEMAECDTYVPFVQQNKPVFHIEYPKDDGDSGAVAVAAAKKTSACEFQDSALFSTVLKNMNLDAWVELC
ncbi:endo alpha-1,4 polygalactosaminidase [Aspergillus homomorphus CBS 101889]|uniref:alpha-galactosidase n=1 Tax=Aspergillus homomorphus (strain CBS 101889) TaxID=1450537 RepID=A0A395HIB9_ASPHC|nr:hypothetical protein BO97DRAFT_473535 [Aspergillus homomorphus CBS 101889]RAL07652.1 hypothetical protein BO97DRAFT_473535 [Aspergillus homomorphus CBS 101889]